MRDLQERHSREETERQGADRAEPGNNEKQAGNYRRLHRVRKSSKEDRCKSRSGMVRLRKRAV